MHMYICIACLYKQNITLLQHFAVTNMELNRKMCYLLYYFMVNFRLVFSE